MGLRGVRKGPPVKPGVKRRSWANLAHSAPLRTCFGWGVREISNFKLQIANLAMVQVRQIPSYIICGSIRCGRLKSEGFGDGCTGLGALPSPSLQQAQAGRCA